MKKKRIVNLGGKKKGTLFAQEIDDLFHPILKQYQWSRWKELDRDGDGQVTLEDLEIAMRKKKLPRRYANEFIHCTRSHIFSKSFGWKQFLSLIEQKEPIILRAYTSLCLSKSGTLSVWFEAATVVVVALPMVIPAGSVLKSTLVGGLAFLHLKKINCLSWLFGMVCQTRVQASTLSFPKIISKLPQIGVWGLYRGSIPVILGQFSRKLVLINFAPTLPEIQGQSLASLCSMFLGTAVRIPCEVLKQWLQAGLFDNVGQAIVGTWHQDGLKGFFLPFYVAGMGLYAESKKEAIPGWSYYDAVVFLFLSPQIVLLVWGGLLCCDLLVCYFPMAFWICFFWLFLFGWIKLFYLRAILFSYKIMGSLLTLILTRECVYLLF
ncbi:hypothetical protein UlMin_030381 [Ulmus minor]